jgi:hypothetical protein
VIAHLVVRRAVPAALVLGAFAFATPAHADVDSDVAALKAATEKYKDVEVALADGFMKDDMCVSSPAGVMGYHYANPKRLEAAPDVTKPPILVYQPDGKGGRKLVAVEYFQADKDQNLKTDDDKPSLYGLKFDGPMLGHTPGMPIHYDLHAWVWQDNPAGMFAQFNPKGSCAVSGEQVSMVPAGGADTGGGSTAGVENTWLFALGAGALALGAGMVTTGRLVGGRRR